MSKYKAGDKVVVEIEKAALTENGGGMYVVLDYMQSAISVDEKSEPLSPYTEPLEDKIKRQAAEITRLLAENEKLKAENGNVIWEIEQAFDRGCNEVWELARKIVLPQSQGGMNDEDYMKVFGSGVSAPYIMNNYTYTEAAAKVAEWEKAKDEIKVGDEVEKNDLRDVRFIVTFTNGRLMNGVTQSGLVFANEKPKEWHKTGRHIDIDGFLKQIGED